MREPLSLVDAAWLHMEEPDNPMVIVAVLLFGGRLSRDTIEGVLSERMVAPYVRFRQRVHDTALGWGAAWEDEPGFDVAGHVEEVVDERPIEDVVSDRMTSRLDLSKSPWDVLVVQQGGGSGGGGAGDRTAAVIRLHHCLGDGFALGRVLLSLADVPPAPLAPPTPATALALRSLALDGPAALAKLLFTGHDNDSCVRGQLSGAKRAAWSRPWPLDAIKAAARRSGAHVNDVLMGALAGAIGRYQQGRGEPPVDVRAFVPVNLRPPTDAIPPTLGNRFGLVYLSLPVGRPTAAERMTEVHARMDAIKATPEAAVAFGIVECLGLVPTQLEHALAHVFGRKASLIVTNVPGPTDKLALAGVPIDGVRFWVPQAGRVAVGVSLMSYAGDVVVAVASDVAVVPDPESIVTAFEAELTSLGVPSP